MHAEFGNYLLVLAFIVSVSLSILPMYGSFTGNQFLTRTAKPLTVIFFVALLASFIFSSKVSFSILQISNKWKIKTYINKF